MTTKTATKSTKNGPQPWPIALALAVLMIVVTVALLFLQMQPATTSIPYRSGQKIDVRYNRHAVEQHGNQALAVRRACENGPEQVWKTRSIENYSFLCQLEGGTWGIMIIKKVKGIWEEVTSFVPKDGTKSAVLRYLDSFATPFKGILP